MQDIQYLGALITYYTRYIYKLAFGITDGEVIDGMNNEDLDNVPATKKQTDPQPPKTYREQIMMFVKATELDINKVAAKYSLTKETTEEDYKTAFNALAGMNKKQLAEFGKDSQNENNK